MSKKHFIQIAATLKVERQRIQAIPGKMRATILANHDNTVRELAYVFAKCNPQFDYNSFYTACGMRDA